MKGEILGDESTTQMYTDMHRSIAFTSSVMDVNKISAK